MVAVVLGQIRGPTINKTTTATIAHVAHFGIPGFFVSPAVAPPLLAFWAELLPPKLPNLLPDFFCFPELLLGDGFDGGGGGGSFVTSSMIRPACVSQHGQKMNRATRAEHEPSNLLIHPVEALVNYRSDIWLVGVLVLLAVNSQQLR